MPLHRTDAPLRPMPVSSGQKPPSVLVMTVAKAMLATRAAMGAMIAHWQPATAIRRSARAGRPPRAPAPGRRRAPLWRRAMAAISANARLTILRHRLCRVPRPAQATRSNPPSSRFNTVGSARHRPSGAPRPTVPGRSAHPVGAATRCSATRSARSFHSNKGLAR